MNRRIMITLFAILTLSTMAVAQTNYEDPSLVGRWTMRNTGGTLVEDFSGNGHFGSLNGAAFFKNDATMVNSVAIIEGSGQVTIPHSKELEPARGTISTFFKVDYLQLADLVIKVSDKTLRTNRRNGVGGAVYGIRLLADGAVEGFIMNDDPLKSQWTMLSTPRSVIKPGTWHHIALQFDGKFVKLFFDGVVLAKQTYKEIPGVGLSYNGETDLVLGFGASFIGQIGETRIYSRPLSDVEVQQTAMLPVSK
jgi:hypothetical protein